LAGTALAGMSPAEALTAYPVASAAKAVSAATTTARAAASSSDAPLKPVSYRGYRFEVPASWPVISNAQHPGSCVRFDLHAVYLGVPGTNQNCPSWLVGTTEAVLIEPGARAARRESAENPVADQVTATAPRIRLTATFDTDPTTIYRILASAGLAAPVITAANPARLAASFSVASPDMGHPDTGPRLTRYPRAVRTRILRCPSARRRQNSRRRSPTTSAWALTSARRRAPVTCARGGTTRRIRPSASTSAAPTVHAISRT
jgi:hypothetical protein